MKLSNFAIAMIALVVLCVLAAFTLLIYTGKPVDDLTYLVLTLVGVAVGSGVTYSKTAGVARQVQSVEAKVNGNLSRLIAKAAATGQDVEGDVAELERISHHDPPQPRA
jgi:hypothetical protein